MDWVCGLGIYDCRGCRDAASLRGQGLTGIEGDRLEA